MHTEQSQCLKFFILPTTETQLRRKAKMKLATLKKVEEIIIWTFHHLHQFSFHYFLAVACLTQMTFLKTSLAYWTTYVTSIYLILVCSRYNLYCMGITLWSGNARHTLASALKVQMYATWSIASWTECKGMMNGWYGLKLVSQLYSTVLLHM